MSSNSARSSSLPPYAAPAVHELAAQSVAPAVSFVPFVPPTWLASLDDAAPSVIAERAVVRAVMAPPDVTGPASASVTAAPFAPESSIEYAAETVSELFSESSDGTFGESVSGFESAPVLNSFGESDGESISESGLRSDDDTLPWIEAFALDPQEEHEATSEQSTSNEESTSNASAEAPSRDAIDDTWVMNEASADIAQLADELSAVSAEAPPNASAPAAEPHLPWQEDEAWMDIMPALPNSGGRDLAAETEWARAFGEPPAPMLPPPLPTGDAQAAAASLESIARRLRAGELNVPGFHAARGDAAALAAALAALLGAND